MSRLKQIICCVTLLWVAHVNQNVQRLKSDTGTIGAEVEYIERLLGVVNIAGFDVLYPTTVSQNIFSLRRISPSYYPLCNREHNSDNAIRGSK